MKIRFLSVALILMFSATLTFAQNARPSIGVLGGLNFQNINGADRSGNTMKNDMIIGYHIGANVQIPLVPEFFFQPGLLFTTKGSKMDNAPVTSTIRLSYIELPLNFVYKGLLGTGYVMVGFGPYLGYAIGGKAIHEGGTASLENDIIFTNTVAAGEPLTNTYFKRMDVGGNVFTGYEMAGGLFFLLNAQLGMLKINPEDNRFQGNEQSFRNTGFGLSVGYRF
jgi:hypothetical protein